MAVASQSVSLEHLRSLIRNVEKPLDRERLPFSLLPSGVPRGALVEVTGPGKTETVTRFLAENKKMRVAWVEEQLTIYPTAVLQKRVALERILFVEAQQELMWGLLQILRSQLFQCVVTSFQSVWAPVVLEKFLRRLQLEAEKSNLCFFILTEKPLKAWPVSVRLQTIKGPSLQLCTLKEKA